MPGDARANAPGSAPSRRPFMSRFQGFLLVSGILIAVVVAAAGFAVGRFFEQHLLAEEAEQTAEVVQNQSRQHLVHGDFASTGQLTSGKGFEALLEGLPRVFRIKAFDRDGRIVWSNEPRLIGLQFPDNPYLARALQGHVTTVLEAPRRAEHVYEHERRLVAEAYVPVVLGGDDRPIGVIESYKDMTAVGQEIRHNQRIIWTFAAATGLFLYVALAVVVWRASASELRALRALEQAHERLAAILAGIADRMVIVDRDMRVVWLNAVGTGEIGGGIGRPCFEVMGAEPAICEQCPAVRTFRSGGVERGVRAERGTDGRIRYLDLVTAPLRDGSGQIHQVLELARDVTELVEMEERLKTANQALLEAQARLVEKERLAAVGAVVVGLHHAILNPLTGILGALQILRDPALDAGAKARALAEAEAEVRKVEQIIRRLPDIERADVTAYVGGTTMLDLERLGREERRS